MAVCPFTNSDGCLISENNKNDSQTKQKKQLWELMGNRGEKTWKQIIFKPAKSDIKDRKLYLQREAAKHLKMVYLSWAIHELFSSLPSLLLTSYIEFSKYSLVIIDGFGFF